MLTVVYNSGYVFLAVLTWREKMAELRWQMTGSDKWFAVVMACAVFIFTIVLLAIRRMRMDAEKTESEKVFSEYSEQSGLNLHEQQILGQIAEEAFVNRKEAIFSMMSAFNRGASKLMADRFTASGSVDERRRLNVAVGSVREKLGFNKSRVPVTTREGRGVNSRDIAIGKRASVEFLSDSGVERVEATVVGNDEYELVLKPDVAVNGRAGQRLNIRYSLGGATWEFSVLTISNNDRELVANHSNQIHFVNKRRFARVPVNKSALTALFPSMKEYYGNCVAPCFEKGSVTELSGSGLRIQTDTEVNIGDRILVIFELEDGKVVQEIGEVKSSRDNMGGQSIGVELIGLRNSSVDELVRAANKAAVMQVFTEAKKDKNSETVGSF